eukprot:TRINITY_DN40061_c0_g2_i1.p2 TRINITY_DN40061_c0_g2~~TRINITY_DN40061_c0_g2_i1.p2  ORF type:complete len:133 (-),score=35.09 TRINITY_DN40061_c0_g2_i1:116-514(-)
MGWSKSLKEGMLHMGCDKMGLNIVGNYEMDIMMVEVSPYMNNNDYVFVRVGSTLMDMLCAAEESPFMKMYCKGRRMRARVLGSQAARVQSRSRMRRRTAELDMGSSSSSRTCQISAGMSTLPRLSTWCCRRP